MWINRMLRLFPKKKIQIGKTAKELDELSEAYFKEQPEEAAEVGQQERNASSADVCEYEILEREILPAKVICPDCGGITLEGLEYCDKCGGELNPPQ